MLMTMSFLSWGALVWGGDYNKSSSPKKNKILFELFEKTQHKNPSEQFEGRKEAYVNILGSLQKIEEEKEGKPLYDIIKEYFLDFGKEHKEKIMQLTKEREKNEELKFNIYYKAIVDLLNSSKTREGSDHGTRGGSDHGQDLIELKKDNNQNITRSNALDFSMLNYLKLFEGQNDLHILETLQEGLINSVYYDGDFISHSVLFDYSNSFYNFGPLEIEENKSKITTLVMKNFIPGNIYRCLSYCNFPYPYTLFTSTKHLYINYSFDDDSNPYSKNKNYQNNLVAFILSIPIYFESLQAISFSDMDVWEKAFQALERIQNLKNDDVSINEDTLKVLLDIKKIYLEMIQKNRKIKILPYTDYEKIKNIDPNNSDLFDENGNLKNPFL